MNYAGASSYCLWLCSQSSHFSILAFSYFESLTEIGCELTWFYLFWIKPSAGQSMFLRAGRSSRGTPCAQLRDSGPHPTNRLWLRQLPTPSRLGRGQP